MQDLPWLFEGKAALVAHRGFAQHFPENTLLALYQAIVAGAAFVEMDVQISADGVPLLLHDDNFLRCGDRPDSVLELPLADIVSISVGEPHRFGQRFSSETPPTLSQVVELLNRYPGVMSFIEIKRHSVERRGAVAAVEAVLDALQALKGPYCLISKCPEVVLYLKSAAITLRGWVLPRWQQQWLRRLPELDPAFVFCNINKLPAGLCLPPGPWHWVVYEVESAAQAHYWRQRGASLIETMKVAELMDSDMFRGARRQ